MLNRRGNAWRTNLPRLASYHR